MGIKEIKVQYKVMNRRERTDDKGEYMKKRWLAVGLSICLIAGMFSTINMGAFAEDVETAPVDQTVVPSEDGEMNQTTGEAAAPTQDENSSVSDGEAVPAEKGTVTPEEEQAPEEDETSISAEEGETPDAEEKVTPVEIQVMDEEGNITFITDDKSPVVEEPLRMARSITVSDKVVNLRANKAGVANNSYIEYTEYGTGEDGYAHGTMGTDAAYIGTFNGKVRFMISGVIGEVSESAVQLVSMNKVTVSTYYANGTNIIHKIATNLNSDTTSELSVGPQQSYMKTGTTYYSYDGHYFYTSYATMLADYRNNTRNNSINANNPYYNYFQYLPMRSTTTYTASQLNSKIQSKTLEGSKMRNLGNNMLTHQNTYGVNALLMTGVAGNESAWGSSDYAQTRNNLFGIDARDASPDDAKRFSSVDACLKEFTEVWMSRWYCNPNNANYYGGFLGNKASGINVKYASDPYWGEKAANIAWSLDSEGRDRFKYTIGIKDVSGTTHSDINVRAGSNTLSTSFFTTGRQTGYSFLVLGQENGFYKVQSDPVLNAGRTAINSSSGVYNFSNMYAYASADYVTIVSGSAGPSPNPGTGSGDTLVVRRGNTYYFKYSLTNGKADLTIPYGYDSDDVLVGDWNGDGIDTLCVRRGNEYHFKNSLSSGKADKIVTYGYPTDEVIVGDWNGDGVDTLCVKRGTTFHFKNSLSNGKADKIFNYGVPTDKVLVGDWNGDGIDTLCVRRGNEYHFRNTLSSGPAERIFHYGWPSDLILVGDWNGDGVDTLCVRRDNAYHIKNSINSGQADQVILYGYKDDVSYAGKWK
jgi:beta-N-acetylglucosaminidase